MCFYRKTSQKDIRKCWDVWDLSVTLILVMVSQVQTHMHMSLHMFAYVQTHQIICIKYVQFFMYQLNKAVKESQSKGDFLNNLGRSDTIL